MNEMTSGARHARLFELLRQQNVAETTVARKESLRIRRISAEEAEELRNAAERSLDRPV